MTSSSDSGSAAAVFHVYDRLALDQMPRRYTVEAGKQLQGRWTTTGAYDLWVLGPNGFHRHIAGDVRRADGSAAPSLVLRSARASGELLIELVNDGGAPCTFVLQANKYLAATPREITVVARSRSSLRIPLAASQNWYDVWFPNLAPSVETMKLGQEAETPAQWSAFVRRYRAEMATPENSHSISLLAALSKQTNFSVGCYCEQEEHCHRSVLRELLASAGAKLEPHSR